ncbi:MAG: VOC family protein [Acidimicrobiales bacterium]|nr:VOC family protein [Acidimicrobiales bacterium]
MGLTARNPNEEGEELEGEQALPGAPEVAVPVTAIDHIAIAVADLDATLDLYRNVFGLTVSTREVLHDDGIEVAVVRVGEVGIQFVAPVDDDADVATFLAEWGPGLHHIGLKVSDAAEALEVLAREGYEVVDEEPRNGLAGTKVAFVNPHDLDGTIIQVVET